MKVFKYELNKDREELIMPAGAEILSAQGQRDKICLWALVDPSKPPSKKRTFRVVGTGHEIAEPKEALEYIGTGQIFGGGLVFHIFEVLG